MSYVCAFRGRRDNYQVPVALADIGLLDCLVTDHYCGPSERALAALLPARLAEVVRSRSDSALPSSFVRRLRTTAGAELLARLARWSAAEVYECFDPHYGEAAARIARRNRSNLFMYSPHAWAAFNANYRHDPRKILFQFHPHHVRENSVLSSDRKASARNGVFFSGSIENLHKDGAVSRLRGDSTWKLAHHVICASEFTRQSLIEVGAQPAQISIVPYGVAAELEIAEEEWGGPLEEFHVLFVGSGIQRKGLHHLLQAWKFAQLPAGARLTIVARTLDPGLSPLLASTPGVNLRRGATQQELRRLYATATLFCMPSLIEGFGQVYLEALSNGVPILGTTSTCCPDIGTEADGVFVTAPGNIEQLVTNLERLSKTLPANKAMRRRARACAANYTWSKFQHGIQAAVAIVQGVGAHQEHQP